MGGRVAEELIFGYEKVSSGASGDIQYATHLARDMVTQWGMSDELGPLQYEEAQGETFLGYSQSQRVHMSDETAKKIDKEIRRIVDGGYDRAKHVLSEHIDELHAVANALLEFETLSGDEVKRIAAGEDIGRDIDGVLTDVRPVDGHAGSVPQVRRRPKPFGDAHPQGA
jgi:cell division protease FtsH